MSVYAVNAVTVYNVHAADANGEPVGPILSQHLSPAKAEKEALRMAAADARRGENIWKRAFSSPAPASV